MLGASKFGASDVIVACLYIFWFDDTRLSFSCILDELWPGPNRCQINDGIKLLVLLLDRIKDIFFRIIINRIVIIQQAPQETL